MKKPNIGLMIALGKPGGPPPRYKAENAEPRPASGEEGGGPPKDPDAGRPEQDVTITPEAVCYHPADQACGACEYYAEGQCKVLKMPVEEGAWCRAFSDKAADSDVPNQEEPGERMGQ